MGRSVIYGLLWMVGNWLPAGHIPDSLWNLFFSLSLFLFLSSFSIDNILCFASVYKLRAELLAPLLFRQELEPF